MASNSLVVSRSAAEGVFNGTACVICNTASGKTLTGRLLTDYLNAWKLVRRVIKSLLRRDFIIRRSTFMIQYLLTARLFFTACFYFVNSDEIHGTKRCSRNLLIDYARERGYSMLELLKYELTSTSQFLTTECKDGIQLKKPDKASLSRELVNQLPQEKKMLNVQMLK